jgi:RNA polymerase sigma-70 factor (ECF subfamily)
LAEIIMADRTNPTDAGTQEAEFVRLLTLHQLDIYLYVHSLLPDSTQAADVTQEVNVVLWEKHKQFDPAKDFRAWAYQIARYKVLKHRSQTKRKGLSFSDALIEQLAVQAPNCTSDDNGVIERLQQCIAKLTLRDRDLLNHRYASTTSCEAIAEVFGRPIRWVHNSLNRIRHELAQCIAGTSLNGDQHD